MNPSYKKEKDHDYMILEAPGRPDGSEYQIRMLLLNSISGLLGCKMRKIDGITEYYYDITEKQPMTKIFAKQRMGMQEIRELLECLSRAACEAERFLLGMEQFILREDYIFRDHETGEFFFCYLPFYEGDLEEDFRALAEYLLKRLDHSQEEAVLWGYDIYSSASEEHFSIGKILESVHERAGCGAPEKTGRTEEEAEILEFLEESEEQENRTEETKIREKEQESKQTEKQRAGILAEEKQVTEIPEISRKKKEVFRKSEKKKDLVKKRNKLYLLLEMAGVFGGAVFGLWHQEFSLIQAGGILILGIGVIVYFNMRNVRQEKKEKDRKEELLQWDFSEEEGKTVFLGNHPPEKFPVLVSLSPDKVETIVLDKERMTVGKQKEQVDIWLNQPGISRVHAALEQREEGWYLVDLGSTNGTFLDGKPLKREERKLEEGMDVCFAAIHFYYHNGTE